MNILFICSLNQNRSKTAEIMFKDNPKHEVRSAGMLCEGANSVTKGLMEWADLVFVMEDWHRAELGKRFPELYLKKRIICLNIPDIYRFNQPELVEVLREKTKGYM